MIIDNQCLTRYLATRVPMSWWTSVDYYTHGLLCQSKKNSGCKAKKERKPERYIHFIYIVLNSYQGANRFCLFILLIVFTIFFHWKGAEVADPATRTLPAARGLAGVAVLDTGSVAHHPVYIHALFSRRRETPGAVANAGAAGDMVATATANFAARFVTMKENT